MSLRNCSTSRAPSTENQSVPSPAPQQGLPTGSAHPGHNFLKVNPSSGNALFQLLDVATLVPKEVSQLRTSLPCTRVRAVGVLGHTHPFPTGPGLGWGPRCFISGTKGVVRGCGNSEFGWGHPRAPQQPTHGSSCLCPAVGRMGGRQAGWGGAGGQVHLAGQGWPCLVFTFMCQA